jgi:DUF971 family protein
VSVTATEIELERATGVLRVSFDDGVCASLPAEYLRVESPSAEVQGHTPDQKQLVFGKRSVMITDLVPVGHYALQIVFSDGHDSGLFSWEYLHRLHTEYADRWPAYLRALEAKGLSRDEQTATGRRA